MKNVLIPFFAPINMGPDGRGVAITSSTAALSDGFTPSGTALNAGNPPNQDEQAIVTYKDADPDTVDVFIVRYVSHSSAVAAAYMARYNGMINSNGTRNTAYQNFIVVQRLLSTPAKQQVIAHELMHVLLNLEHRTDNPNTSEPEFADSATSLFYESSATDSNGRLLAKRIGPFAHLGGAFIDEDDVEVIRDFAEILPT